MMRSVTVALAILATASGAAPAAGAATAKPNEKTTVTDIQWRISYSVEIPGNCAVLGFSQWQASKFKGWDVYKLSFMWAGTTTVASPSPISSPPKYDDELKYGGNVVAPPNGSHWLLIGDGTFRAGPPPAEAECQAILARSQAQIAENKVTTYYRRTSACAAKFDTLTKAEKANKKAKSKQAKAKAKKNLSKAKTAFNKDCSK